MDGAMLRLSYTPKAEGKKEWKTKTIIIHPSRSNLVLNICGLVGISGDAPALLRRKNVRDERVLAAVVPAQGAAEAQQDGHRGLAEGH